MTDDQRLTDLANPRWFTQPENSSIWVRGYLLPAVHLQDLGGKSHLYDFKKARCVLTYGALRYLNPGAPWLEVTPEKQIRFRTPSSAGLQDGPTGTYLLIVLPYEVDGQPGNDESAKDALTLMTATLAVGGGRAIVWDLLFDNIIQLKDGACAAYSPVVENPLWQGVPDVSVNQFVRTAKTLQWIEQLTEQERRRVSTSLRWFEAATRETGVDGLIKYWIAVETLAMPDDVNIRPVNETLSRIYGLTIDRVREQFKVGRIQGLRSRIVHNGQRVGIHGQLLAYLEALYVDLFMDMCGFPSPRRAIAQVKRGDFDLEIYLKGLEASQ